jgi:hypothetical protein
VLTITDREAYVEGDHDVYLVTFRGLTCTCEAGGKGLHCSHVQAALRERARMHGFEHTAFSPNQQHADAYAAMQRAAGKRAMVLVEYGYFIVQSGKPVPPVPRQPRPMADVQAAADALFA